MHSLNHKVSGVCGSWCIATIAERMASAKKCTPDNQSSFWIVPKLDKRVSDMVGVKIHNLGISDS